MYEEESTPEETARYRRQNALYSAQSLLQGVTVSADELVSVAKRILSFLETGE